MRKRILILVSLSLWCHVCVHRALAAFERQETGARQSGMGGAFSAVGGDVHSLLHNPAGLAYLNRKELSSSYSKLSIGLDDKSDLASSLLLYGQPINRWGSLGAGWLELKLDGLYKERTLALGYGHAWTDKLALGAVLKQLQVSVEAPGTNYDNNGMVEAGADPTFARRSTAGGIGADLGILYEPIPKYSLGLSVQNINRPKVALADSNHIPTLIRFGMAHRSSAFLVASEARTQEYLQGRRDYQAIFAAERWKPLGTGSSFAFRGSMGFGSRSFSQLTMGLGYRLSGMQMDYAFLMPLSGVSFGSTYGTHKLSFSLRFGKTVPREIAWTFGEADNEELEAAKRRAAQAELLAQLLQDKIKQLEEELERQIAVSTMTITSRDLEKEAWRAQRKEVLRGLEKKIRLLKRELEKASRRKLTKPVSVAAPEIGKLPANPAKARELYKEGVRYYYINRQLDKAASAFRKSLESDPTNEWVKKALERILVELGQEQKSQEAFRPQGVQYSTRKGDTLWSLAEEFYGDLYKWTLIRDANPGIKDPYALPEGTVITIPLIPETPGGKP